MRDTVDSDFVPITCEVQPVESVRAAIHRLAAQVKRDHGLLLDVVAFEWHTKAPEHLDDEAEGDVLLRVGIEAHSVASS